MERMPPPHQPNHCISTLFTFWGRTGNARQKTKKMGRSDDWSKIIWSKPSLQSHTTNMFVFDQTVVFKSQALNIQRLHTRAWAAGRGQCKCVSDEPGWIERAGKTHLQKLSASISNGKRVPAQHMSLFPLVCVVDLIFVVCCVVWFSSLPSIASIKT